MSLIIQQVIVVGTLAIGQTIIILTAGIDLSVGAIMVFVDRDGQALRRRRRAGRARVARRLRLRHGCAASSTALLITRLKLPPFIVTLGTLNIFFALNLY